MSVRRNRNDIKAELSDVSLELEALAKSESATVEELQALQAKADNLEKEFDQAVELEKIKAEILAKREAEAKAAVQPSVFEAQQPKLEEVKEVIPATAKSQKSKVFASSEDAYTAGMYLAALGGDHKAKDFMAAQSGGTDNKGGFAVPSVLSNQLINLVEEAGVARQYCQRIVMSSDNWSVPKVTAQASISYPSEASAISESDVTFSQVSLSAKKMAALVKMSTEISEDAVISMVDTITQSLALSMATAEDDNLFNGVASAINANGIAGDASVDDTNVASAGALALTDLTACATGIGNPIRGASNAWYINPVVYHGQIRDLVNAAGGNTIQILEGGQQQSLLGYPVVLTNILPSAPASGELVAVFGDLRLGCYFGDRRSLNFKVLSELFAANDQVAIQCTQRIDLAVANPEVLAKITIT
jgi:HK97 family phage major capsid protein